MVWIDSTPPPINTKVQKHKTGTILVKSKFCERPSERNTCSNNASDRVSDKVAPKNEFYD